MRLSLFSVPFRPGGNLTRRWREALRAVTMMRGTPVGISNLLLWESKQNLQYVLKILSF